MTKKLVALVLAGIIAANANVSAVSHADFVAQEVAAFVAESKEAGLTDEQMIEVLEKSTNAPALTTKQRNALLITAGVLGAGALVLGVMKYKKLGFFADKEVAKDEAKKDEAKDEAKKDEAKDEAKKDEAKDEAKDGEAKEGEAKEVAKEGEEVK